jgi:hypothetical protein
MTSRQNICTAMQYHIYGVAKSAWVCDKQVSPLSKYGTILNSQINLKFILANVFADLYFITKSNM